MYPAIFYKEQDGAFSVVFPDLNHLATDGENLEEAMQMAIDCLAGYIYSAEQDGETLPEPTPVEKVDIHCEDEDEDDYEFAFVNLVAVDVKEYAEKHFEKPVKKTLTVPAWLNQTAVDMNINFSAALKNRLSFICANPEKMPFAKKNYSGVLNAILSSSGAKPLGAAVSEIPNPLFEKNVKKTLTLPKWLNERALAMNINFSAVLKEALLEACRNKSV